MAFGAGSEIFTQFINSVMENYTPITLSTDTCKIALFNDSVSPDQNAVVASTAFNAGTWTTGNEVTDATGGPSTGNPLLTPTHVAGTALWTYDAPDLVSLDTHTTLTGTFGCLVYDHTIASVCVDEGVCYLSFGGTQSVSAGTFTIVFHTSGIFAITL